MRIMISNPGLAKLQLHRGAHDRPRPGIAHFSHRHLSFHKTHNRDNHDDHDECVDLYDLDIRNDHDDHDFDQHPPDDHDAADNICAQVADAVIGNVQEKTIKQYNASNSEVNHHIASTS